MYSKEYTEHLKGWNNIVVELIKCQNDNQLLDLIIKALYFSADIDSIVVFLYSHESKPVVLYDDAIPVSDKGSTAKYVSGYYLINPFYQQSLKQRCSGLYTLNQLISERFWEDDFFSSYYKYANVIDEIDLLLPVGADKTLAISMGRDLGREPFSAQDIASLKAIEPLVTAFTQQYINQAYEEDSGSVQASQGHFTSLEAAIDSCFDKSLTSRERDVVFLMFRGESGKEISRLLGVSPGTIKAHKSNIYSKLNISTQGDLFSLFIDYLSESQG